MDKIRSTATKTVPSYPVSPLAVKQTARSDVSKARPGTIYGVNPRNLFALGAALALVVSYFAWDWYLSPHAQVERLLDRAAAAAEEKDFDEVLSCLSPDYTGFRNMDYQSLAQQLQEGFEKVDRLNVTLRRVRADVDGDEATATFDLMVVAIRDEQRFIIFGTLTQPERLRAFLRRENDDWKIHRVELSGDESRRE